MRQSIAALAACLLTVSFFAACTANQNAGQALDDATLTARLEGRLAADPEVSGIDVDVSDRIATLSGTVESRAAARRALEIASDTRGVTGVIDHLTRPEEQSVVDARVSETVAERLQGTEGLDASGIVVSADGGVVTLSGTVASAEERETARTVARETGGVTRVRDALRLGNGG